MKYAEKVVVDSFIALCEHMRDAQRFIISHQESRLFTVIERYVYVVDSLARMIEATGVPVIEANIGDNPYNPKRFPYRVLYGDLVSRVVESDFDAEAFAERYREFVCVFANEYFQLWNSEYDDRFNVIWVGSEFEYLGDKYAIVDLSGKAGVVNLESMYVLDGRVDFNGMVSKDEFIKLVEDNELRFDRVVIS